MISRDLTPSLLADAKKVPVIAILGPRQSGKTTLARLTFPEHTYVSLEDLDRRAYATQDPRGFLETFANTTGIILDEVQHVPGILSYIQTNVDMLYRPGHFVLTGSQNFLVMEAITQTLAGRISLHTLLPLSIHELKQAEALSATPEQAVFKGFYPILYSGKEDNPTQWYSDYIQTYVERDVRTITQVTDLTAFRRFMGLCAGRIGQLVNFTSLGNDCGVSYNTAKAWLSVLQASYIIFELQPHSKNFNRRLVQSSKLFFYDSGLACALLGIETEEQLRTHYLRGGLFEGMIIADFYKNSYNADNKPRIYFWRDKTGNEIDCIIEQGSRVYPIEIKSGKTISSDYFSGISNWNALAQADASNSFVVYGGDENQKRSAGNVVSWDSTIKIPGKNIQ
jgi:predicted AAA+ superfamily ATPase